MPTEKYLYDVFLSHNSQDKPAVEWLAERLEDEAGLVVFLDKWNLVPGEPWQEDLEQALAASEVVVVFLGPSGISSWHNKELRDALNTQAKDKGRRVVPVILPGTDFEKIELPSFLSQLTWVDFRSGLEDEEPLRRLVAGITGKPPGRPGKTTGPRRPPPPQPEPEKESSSSSAPAAVGVQVGNISGISGGEVNIAGGNIEKKTIHTGGGTYIGGGVSTGGGDFVGRDKITHNTGVSGEDLGALFEKIFAQINSRPDDPDVEKDEIKQTVENIQKEVDKGESANGNKVKRWLGSLAGMAPDIFDVVTDTLTSPVKGVATVIKKIAQKAKELHGT